MEGGPLFDLQKRGDFALFTKGRRYGIIKCQNAGKAANWCQKSISGGKRRAEKEPLWANLTLKSSTARSTTCSQM